MIQLNLLPDVKLEYIKAQKTRSLVMGVSVVVTSVSILILILFLVFGYAQKAHINSLKNTITTYSSELQNKPNIGTILTVQNQLKSLGALYTSRPAAARLFDTYLNEVTPETVSLNQMSADFTKYTLTLTGTADSLTTVNQYVDTLKLTTFALKGSSTTTPAFNDVVLASFGINSQAPNPAQAASFTIDLNFDQQIFNIAETPTLTVPNITVTHSEQQDSGSLFQNAPASSKTGGQ